MADIFVRTDEGQEIAVEIQCSDQSVPSFVDRTQTYTDLGIHVLWLIEKSTYLPHRNPRNRYVSGTAYRSTVKWLQRHYFGRCYVFSRDSLETPDKDAIAPYRLQSKQRECTSYNPNTGIQHRYTQYYDTIAEATTGSIDDYALLTTESNGFRIARFYDPVWWKGDGQ